MEIKHTFHKLPLMGIKVKIFRIVSPFFLGLSLLFLAISNAFASSGTISVVPANGTYQKGQTFTAAIKVDGGGTAFNAAKASVAVSQNLSVQNVTLGDCDFAFVKTPSVSSLSFAGVVLGSSKNFCTVYTVDLRVGDGSSGFVFISDGSIKSYKGASELLSAVNNSSYIFSSNSTQNVGSNTIAVTSPTPTQPPLSLANGVKLYTLVYNIATPGKTPSSTLQAILDPGQPNQTQTTPQADPQDPSVLAATFENVPEGVHTISILDKNTPVSKQIVNVQGTNREITLGVTPKPNGLNSAISYIALAVILVLLITGGIFTYLIFWRKNHPGTS